MDGLTANIEKMRAAGAPAGVIESFRRYYERLRAGDTGVLAESDLEPVEDLPEVGELPAVGELARREPGGGSALDAAVVIKLNGGLGTSMGLSGPKSLLKVKDGLSFLDIIVRQVLDLRRRSGARVPLVLMNSFATREETLAELERHPEISADVPPEFVQNRVPKIARADLQPVSWPPDPALEWAPPGHGDLYTAIATSGMLDTLLGRGYRYAFVSNSDNLGAVFEPRILAWLAYERIPFLMEVTERTATDRKGGHLARLRCDGLALRETAQVQEADLDAFQDIGRHRFFNTNNLWLDLQALAAELDRQGCALDLPLIVNPKTVDPSDPSSPAVIQLETAMGQAIQVFDGARALRVPRRRFAPVKTTSDLLAVRSDAYRLTDEAHVELAPQRGDSPPVIELDPPFYKLLGDFETRFSAGPPSLVACDELTVIGDVSFGAGVVVRGTVAIEHRGESQLRIADGTVLEGEALA